jgi:hypothetical protein
MKNIVSGILGAIQLGIVMGVAAYTLYFIFYITR